MSSSGHLTVSLGAPGAGSFAATATFRARLPVLTHRHRKRVVKHVTRTYTYGGGDANSFEEGSVKLGIGLRGPAGRALKKAGHATARIAIVFTPASGSSHEESTTVAVRWRRPDGFS